MKSSNSNSSVLQMTTAGISVSLDNVALGCGKSWAKFNFLIKTAFRLMKISTALKDTQDCIEEIQCKSPDTKIHPES